MVQGGEVPEPSAQVRAYLRSPAHPAESYWEMTVSEARARYREECRLAGGQPESVASVEELDAGGVPARLYRPVGAERNVFVWNHGGGWTLGHPDCSDTAMRALANRAGCAVLSVDYRLSPEHPYPAAIEDAWAATEWATETFDAVAVGGDSAGGNLAAAVALRARDRNVDLLLQVLVYPVLDHRVDGPFYRDFVRRYKDFAGDSRYGAKSRDGIAHVWDNYVPHWDRRSEEDASPMCADSLVGSASAVVITAEHDILRGEDEAYADRLAAEGVQVELITYPGQIHGFYNLLGMMDDALDAIGRSAVALRRAFEDGGNRTS